jgi:hypothetical protein
MTMYTKEALEIAQKCISTVILFSPEVAPGLPRFEEAKSMIQAIIDQRGCDHLESGCDELTHLMDVIICG